MWYKRVTCIRGGKRSSLFEANYFRLLFDGAASISLSALLAALTRGYFSFQAVQETGGVMLLASIFLLPSTVIAFGVSSMVFAAYEFVQKRAERKGLEEGLEKGLEEGLAKGQKEGQQAERQRIERELEALVSNGDGSATVSREDIKRIIRPARE